MIYYKCVTQIICLSSTIRQLLAVESQNYGFWGITGPFRGPLGYPWSDSTRLISLRHIRLCPIKAILKKGRKVIKLILRNQYFSMKIGKNSQQGGPSTPSGVPSERMNQNRLAMLGRTHPLKAILKRRTGIKTILRNQQFNVKICKNGKFGAFKGQWGTHGVIKPEPSCQTRWISS